jgi:hypothetical protein
LAKFGGILIKRVVFTSDLQIPFHNPRQVAAHVRFIGDYQPDQVVNIGDLTDYPQPSRWTKDSRGEFEGSIWVDSEKTKRTYFEPLRKVYDGPIGLHIGNHDSRPLDYQRRYAPALDSATKEDNPFYYGNLVDFKNFGVEDLGGHYDIAPGWMSTHGHLGLPLRQVAGGTAIAGARKYGVSVVCGHTHRMGIVNETSGKGRHEKTITGFEVGNMMDMSKAGYIQAKAGMANWQSGFGVLYVNGKTVTPVAVPMKKDGSFIFEGRKWS